MKSRWSHLRNEAESLGRNGESIKTVSARLGISLSTLSGWFKDIKLTPEQKEVLRKNWIQGLVVARIAAAQKHCDLKEARIEKMRNEVQPDYSGILAAQDRKRLEIALAILYLGEGSKTDRALGLGNSDPVLLKFYVDALEELYPIDRNTLSASLHLRMDQNAEELKKYWSEQINIPIDRFKYVLRDKRTAGKPTYPDYLGVCYIDGGGVEIQRRLRYLAKVLCTGQF